MTGTEGRGFSHRGPRAFARQMASRVRGSRGMVTAEIAIGLLGIAAVVAMLIHAIGIGITAVKVQEASRAAARAAARGDDQSDIVRTARNVAPDAKVSIDRGTDEIHVEVSARAGPLPGLPKLTVSGSAVAHAEQ